MLLLARCVPKLGRAPKPPSINPTPLGGGHPIPPLINTSPTAPGDVDGLVFPWVGSEISPAAGATRPALETPPGWCVTPDLGKVAGYGSFDAKRTQINYRMCCCFGVFSGLNWLNLVILRKSWDWTDSITRLYHIVSYFRSSLLNHSTQKTSERPAPIVQTDLVLATLQRMLVFGASCSSLWKSRGWTKSGRSSGSVVPVWVPRNYFFG